ncbi:MAG: hypothetical protein MI920_11520 [Kiloniellales bacterium]|nr:hypothetical protein [Kiloniellales bacterium]
MRTSIFAIADIQAVKGFVAGRQDSSLPPQRKVKGGGGRVGGQADGPVEVELEDSWTKIGKLMILNDFPAQGLTPARNDGRWQGSTQSRSV